MDWFGVGVGGFEVDVGVQVGEIGLCYGSLVYVLPLRINLATINISEICPDPVINTEYILA